MQKPREISRYQDLELPYDAYLFDAYGVLVNGEGLIEDALAFWKSLQAQGKQTMIVSNGSARTPEEALLAYQKLGIPVQTDEFLSSVSLLPAFFAKSGLLGKRCAVLGTAATAEMVRRSGAIPVAAIDRDPFECVLIANQTEYPILSSLDHILSHIIERVEASLPITIVVSNPDLIYPKAQTQFGITAGSLAGLLKTALNQRLRYKSPTFSYLGKPYPEIFAEAARRMGTRNLLMIGDQLETDIAGAQAFGIDSLLVKTGLFQDALWEQETVVPTYLLRS